MAHKLQKKYNPNVKIVKARYNGKGLFPKQNSQYQSYTAIATRVAKFLTPKRQQAINNIDELKKYKKVAENWCNLIWNQTLTEEAQKSPYKHHHYSPQASTIYVPQSKLTKNGDINEAVAKSTLEKLSDTFNLEDSQPFMLGDSLIHRLIEEPKTVVAETYINGVGKHERPCFIVRKLLSCKLDGNTYMLVADEKYYHNSPTVAMPLTLLVGGQPKGVCQLARIDSVGHLGEDAAESLGIKLQKPTLVPDYLQEKFDASHHNAVVPGKKKSKNSKFQTVKKISAAHHLHVRDSNFELMYALCHMATNCIQIYKNNPSKFLKFNAKELSEGDIYIEDYKQINKYNTSVYQQIKLMTLLNELKSLDIVNNSSVINTETLQNLFVRTFNLTNFENDKKLNQFLDELRTFKPTRLVKPVDPKKVVGPRKYLQVPGTEQKQFTKSINRIIDYDYIKTHPEDYVDFLLSYREMVANKGNNLENVETPTTLAGNTSKPSTTPPGGYGDGKGTK